MLYIGAIEGTGDWAAPKQIVRMTDLQAALSEDADRRGYPAESLKPAQRQDLVPREQPGANPG
jgi:hypothetical protein